MSLSFKYIPLTFLNDVTIIKEQIKNTVILRYLFDKYNKHSTLEKLIIGTQYGYNASALQSGKNKFLRISDITDGKVNWDTVPFCDCSDENTYLLDKNDLLIARTGGKAGKSFIIDNPPEKAIFAGYLIRIRANQENNPEFLNLFLNSYAYWSQVVSLNKGEFRPSVNASKLKDLIVPKIDVEIQRDAVNISKGISVDGYEALENNISKALNDFEKSQEIIEHFIYQGNNIKLLKQSIIQEAIEGKLTADWREQNPDTEPASELLNRIKAEKAQLVKDKKIKKEKPLPPITEEEIPFELPEGWIWCRLGAVSLYLNGKGFDSSDFQKSNGVKCIKITNAGVGEIVETDDTLPNEFKEIYSDYLVYENDIIIALTRPYIADGLKVSLCPKRYNESLLNQRVAVIKGFSVKNEYIYKFLRSDFVLNGYKEEFDSKGQQPNLKTDHITNLLFPLPPFEEQKAIVEKIETLMQKCNVLEEEIKTSEANAQMLMKQF